MLVPVSILIVNVTRIGDTFAATPVIDRLHKQWPNAKITVIGGVGRVEVIDGLPGVVRVSTLSKRSARFCGWLATSHYDLALVFNYDESLVRYALRVSKKVVAFRQKSPDINQRLYLCVEPDAYPTEHITEHFLRLTHALGIDGTNGRIHFRPKDSEVTLARSLIEVEGLTICRPLIGFQIASFPTKSYRDWPVESFLELGHMILAKWENAHFLIFGGTDEKKRTLWLKQQLGNNACHLAGRMTLRETGAAMSLIDLFVGVDTGPTHMMSSYDIPIIGLYHPRHPARCLGPKDHPFNFSLDHPFNDDIDGEPRPMSDITVDQVFSRVKVALTTRGFG